ncbi:MerR family transcriptional regulator [Gordonia rubripertincta]|uniref:MerR family transcriptional regulator n=1 Tax=Gordonia rubripertincta TaxID=36822 RepID=A0ABT4MXN5_GORRU|nr:MerR family transcriptional regulator [Gordonia rubripertincta]MCZ4550981.1 MerR family transcriptional regulator [Gordonia rubripertincta]
MLIGELSRQTGVSARMLRHYDSLGLVRPTDRSDGGYREYSNDDILRIFRVESLRSLGLSLREVQRALDEPDFAPTELVGELIEQTRERLAREQELLDRLHQVNDTDPGTWSDVLGLIELVRDLGSDRPARRQQAVFSAAEDGSASADVLADALLVEAVPNVAGALGWSLARLGNDAVAALARGLESSDTDVRRRATMAIAKIDGPDATTLLERALTDEDLTIRSQAAIELGSRGFIHAAPALIDAIVAGSRDVEAADVLGALAQTQQTADDLTGALVQALDESSEPPVRSRLAQALTEIPGSAAHLALARLTEDDDLAVAYTARAVLSNRSTTSTPTDPCSPTGG